MPGEPALEFEMGIVRGNKKHLPSEKIITVEKNMPPVSWTLKPNYDLLSVNSCPAGMTVKINGEVAGKTPIPNEILDPGAYEVIVANPSYNERENQTWFCLIF